MIEFLEPTRSLHNTDECWHVALSATFDVENYGDLLFPLLAQSALSRRLGSVTVHPYSYHAKSQPDWPYTVTSLTEFPHAAASFSAVLIGGGHIIRFDKEIAPGYGPPTPDIHHPTGYWLSPGLLALQHNVPLIWNAPSVHGAIPSWAVPLLKLTLDNSSYISVRDTGSANVLSSINGETEIHVVPDTAFAVPDLIDTENPSADFIALRRQYGLEGPYIIIQATRHGLMFFCRMLLKHPEAFKDYKFLLLSIGPAVGDDPDILPMQIPGLVQLPFWPKPLLIAELISHAEGVVGSSYHLSITALASGVPVFSTVDLSRSKLAVLAGYENIYPLPIESDIYPPWFLKRLGKTTPSAVVRGAQRSLDVHWDHIARLIRQGATNSGAAMNTFWPQLPALLEKIATSHETTAMAFLQSQQERDANAAALLRSQQERNANAAALLRSQHECDVAAAALLQRQEEIRSLNRSLNKIYRSHAYRVTAPLRWTSRALKDFKRLLKKRSKHD